jgi:hypothetical protein
MVGLRKRTVSAMGWVDACILLSLSLLRFRKDFKPCRKQTWLMGVMRLQ